MSEGSQRVVVIQDAVREICPSAIRWVIQGFSLKPGDMLVLFAVLHQVINPMGYKVKVDSSSMFGINPKLIADEVSKKTQEYLNNPEIIEISKLCESQQIEFCVEVRAGSSPKEVALKAAKSFKATWVILDRQMKKDKKYFLENLSTGISRMKRDNTIEELRGPKEKVNKNIPKPRSGRTKGRIRYDEMIPEMVSKGPKDGLQNSAKSSSSRERDDHNIESQRDYYKASTYSSDNLMTPVTSTPSLGILRASHEIPHDFKTSASFYKSLSSDHPFTATTSASSTSLIEAEYFEMAETTNNTENQTTGELVSYSVAPESQKEVSSTKEENEQQNHNHHDEDWIVMNLKDEMFKNYKCTICKNRRPKVGWTKDFSYAELYAATEGFATKNFLSEGGFGSVYKGKINGLKIAVKQHKTASFQGEKEFKSEVNVLSRARHENLVMLLGSCSERSHRLLVYEFVCNGSLDQHLSRHSRKPLSWEERMRVATGAAKGLQFLHQNNIVHRDMRPNNILVTHDHEVLLGDFGLARTQDGELSSETRVVGTLGYMAPEYAECGKVSTKTDVYSFGVVLLQLITGLKTTDKILGGKSLVGWARPLLKEKNYPDLIDPRILDSHDVHQLFWMVRVAEKCLSKDPQKRLTMDKVVYALDYLMESSSRSSITAFSPAGSDSLSSTRDSLESQDDDTTFTLDAHATSVTSFSQESMTYHPPSTPIRLLP